MRLNIKKINRLMKEHDINRSQLAKKMKCSRQRISFLLKKQTDRKLGHTFQTVESFAKVLGVKATDLIQD
jgi:transcriptional regulator with XRE-family HTH domain